MIIAMLYKFDKAQSDIDNNNFVEVQMSLQTIQKELIII